VTSDASDAAERHFDERLYEQVCFACGRKNSIGLHLTFAPVHESAADGSAREGVEARYAPRPEDQGFPGVMHGGILVTLLDEAMAWAMFAHDNSLGMTAKMEVRYRRQVPPDAPLTVRGFVTRVRGRRIEVEATLFDTTGQRLVESSGLFLRLPQAETNQLLADIGWAQIWAEGGPLRET
jgi:acyl-coenzyme A thioesterase PaaI-like protein